MNIECLLLSDDKKIGFTSKQVIHDELNYELVFHSELPVSDEEHAELILNLICEKMWSINSTRDLKEINESFLYFPSGCFVVIKMEDNFYRIDLPKSPFQSVKKSKRGFAIRIPLKNRKSCGLSLFSEDKIISLNDYFSFSLLINKIQTPEQTAWAEPFPGGANSALVITDHADWESIEKFGEISRLLVKNKINITKSVFPYTEEYEGSLYHGLNTPGYKELLQEFYQAGNEIAFHGFTSARNAPSITKCRELMNEMADFNPETWIDHGIGDYLFSRKGILENGERLIDFLTSYGIKNLWSYGDTINNPDWNLNSFSVRSSSQIFADMLSGIAGNSNFKPAAILYIIDHCQRNFLGHYVRQKILSAPVSAATYRFISKEYRLIKHIRKFPLSIYGENGFSPLLNKEHTWIFDTVLSIHLTHQLRKKAIDRLIDDGGIAILHTYFANQKPYIVNNVFTTMKGKNQILPKFKNSLEYIAEKQSTKEIITLPFNKLRASLEKLAKTKMLIKNNEWKISTDIFIRSAKV